MRICVVTIAGHGIGGMQDHTRDLARGLAAAGHDVAVITTRHPHGLRSELRDGARWHFVDAQGRSERLPFHHRGWLRGSHELFVGLNATSPFDVVHSESTSALELVRHRLHRRVPIVVQYHGNFIGLARAGWRRAVDGDSRARLREAKAFLWMCGMHVQRGECFRFHDCDWIVPSHQQFEDTLRGEFLRRELGHVVPNGVDGQVFRPRDRREARAELGLDAAARLLVCVGRLNFEKGFDLALRALGRLSGDFPDTRLVVVGEGEERDALGTLSAALDLEDRVSFVGAKAPEEVAKYMAAADVYLFPTQREEAAPLVLPQAMACGAAVVASRIGGISEVVGESGDNGVLVPAGDERALVDAVGALLQDAAARERLGAAARERVLAEYTVERMVDRTLAVYEVAAHRFASRSPRGRDRS